MLTVLRFEGRGAAGAASGPPVALFGVAHREFRVDGVGREDAPARTYGPRPPAYYHGGQAGVSRDHDVFRREAPDDGKIGGVGARPDLHGLNACPLGVAVQVLGLVAHEHDRDMLRSGGRNGVSCHGAGICVNE